MTTLQPGDVFAGYTIERLLGAGGMGEVYLARHPRLPRHDAIKILAAALADDDHFRTRFEREADVVAGLRHPSIVTVHDRGEADGRLWIAFEYIDGADLATVAARGPMAPADVVRIVGEVADALDDAGARGLVHRDVKPANILIDEKGRALLTDFGIAHGSDEVSQLTGTGVTVGTVAYSSPEQLQAADLDSRSDQYSLACTAFALLTGTLPYAGASPTAMILAHIRDAIPSAAARRPGLPPAVDAVFRRALAKEPAQRFPTNRSFADALRTSLDGAPAQSTDPTVKSAAAAALTAAAAPTQSTATPPPQMVVTQHASPGYSPAAEPAPMPRSAQAAPSRPAARTGSTGRRITLIAAAAVVVLVVIAVVTLVALKGKDSSGTDASETPTVSVEGLALKKQPVSGYLVSLAAKPAAAKWKWTPSQNLLTRGIIGGTDKYALMGAMASNGVLIDIVDAENGKTVRSVKMPGQESIHNCLTFGSQTAAVCELAAGTYTVIDVDKGTASPTFTAASGSSSSWAMTGDTVVIAGDTTVAAYDSTGRLRWKAATGSRNGSRPYNGSPVVAVDDGAVFTLRSVADGKTVYRRDRTLDLNDRDTAVSWQPFLGGFVVQDQNDRTKSQYFDATGKLTATVKDWLPITWSVGGSEPPNVTSLPMVASKDNSTIGALNPATGHVIWERHVNDGIATLTLVGAFGTKTMVNSTGSTTRSVDQYMFDCYDASGGEYAITSSGYSATVMGTDGTRVLTGGYSRGLAAYEAWHGAAIWTLTSDSSARYVVAGKAVYSDDRRVL